MRALFLTWLAVLALPVPLQSSAATPQALVDGGDLTVSTALSPPTDIVPGQHLRLLIEVATTRWFTGGTRIDIPEVPGLVVAVDEEDVTVDFNHPLAGRTILFDVLIHRVEAAELH